MNLEDKLNTFAANYMSENDHKFSMAERQAVEECLAAMVDEIKPNPTPETPEKEWWMPYWNAEDEYLDWLADHLGDAADAMNRMWKEICKFRPELPENGFNSSED